jgi:hypothetical protein
METQRTHYKQLINLDYLGSYSLDGKDLTVKIIKVVQEPVTGTGGKKELCMIAKLEGQKDFILNRTNAKMITKLYGSPYIEDWEGKSITLYSSTTSVGGETVECLRIRPTLPVVTKVDNSAVIKSLNACKSIEELQSVYSALTAAQQLATVGTKDVMKAKLSVK